MVYTGSSPRLAPHRAASERAIAVQTCGPGGLASNAVVTAELTPEGRATLVSHGQILSRLSLAYNSLEAIVSLVLGAMAGSISLIGFGADSVIEVSSSIAALWRLRADADAAHRDRVEAITLRLIGLSFLGLAVYIAIDAGRALFNREAPERTVPGIVIAAASVVIMPLLAQAKRRVGLVLGSRALTSDAMQTSRP